VEEIHDCASGLGREAVIRTAEYLTSRQSRVLHNLLDKQSLNSAHDLQNLAAEPRSAPKARRSQRFDEIIQIRRKLSAKSGALTGR
jgi:hypothetical protein